MSILGFICIHLEKDGPDRLLNESYIHWNPLGREETERVLVCTEYSVGDCILSLG